MPIKKEIQMHQKKISALENDFNKYLKIFQNTKEEYQSSKDMFEIY